MEYVIIGVMIAATVVLATQFFGDAIIRQFSVAATAMMDPAHAVEVANEADPGETDEDGGGFGDHSDGDDQDAGGSQIPADEFSNHTDDFANNVTSGNFRNWKQEMVDAGYSPETIQEIIHQGSLQKGENIWGEDWSRYFREISGTQPPNDMTRPHAHHLVQKRGGGAPGVLNRTILEEAGINPLLSRHNFGWAPNIAGQHGAVPQGELLQALLPVRGDRAAIINVLSEWRAISAGR